MPYLLSSFCFLNVKYCCCYLTRLYSKVPLDQLLSCLPRWMIDRACVSMRLVRVPVCACVGYGVCVRWVFGKESKKYIFFPFSSWLLLLFFLLARQGFVFLVPILAHGQWSVRSVKSDLTQACDLLFLFEFCIGEHSRICIIFVAKRLVFGLQDWKPCIPQAPWYDGRHHRQRKQPFSCRCQLIK